MSKKFIISSEELVLICTYGSIPRVTLWYTDDWITIENGRSWTHKDFYNQFWTIDVEKAANSRLSRLLK